jgi:hypothetical protein
VDIDPFRRRATRRSGCGRTSGQGGTAKADGWELFERTRLANAADTVKKGPADFLAADRSGGILQKPGWFALGGKFFAHEQSPDGAERASKNPTGTAPASKMSGSSKVLRSRVCRSMLKTLVAQPLVTYGPSSSRIVSRIGFITANSA